MPSLQIERPAACLPVALDEMKNFLRVEIDDDDDLITSMISAITGSAELFCDRSFISKGYIQTLDSFPYFADTQLSQNAMPPSYYSLPMYSTTLWNYSQQIKLFAAPLISVDALMYMASADSQWHALVPVPPVWYPLTAYVAAAAKSGNTPAVVASTISDPNGNIQRCIAGGKSFANPPLPAGTPSNTVPNPGYYWNADLNGVTTEASGVEWQNIGPVPQQDPIVGGSQGKQFGSFIIDTNSEPARLFPGPAGNYWPPVLYLPNAVQIHFTSGYGDAPADVPDAIRLAIMLGVSDLYENREPVGKDMTLPKSVKALLYPYQVTDICPTRG